MRNIFEMKEEKQQSKNLENYKKLVLGLCSKTTRVSATNSKPKPMQ